MIVSRYRRVGSQFCNIRIMGREDIASLVLMVSSTVQDGDGVF
jgi:hypothetical protein